MANNQGMLIPRFSIRWLLVLTTFAALFFFVMRQATQGRMWAVAVAMAAASFVILVVVHCGVFLVAWGISLLRSATRRPVQPASPFATDRVPEQIIPPLDPD